MHEHFKYVFSLYLVYRPIKASCATVWPNQKVPALLDRKCSQLKFNTRLKQLSLSTTSDHYRVRALSWMCGQCIDCKGEKKWPHTLARRRETVMFGHGGSEVLVWRKKSQAQILSIHTLASLIGNVGEGFPPPAAVILISWVSRDETPVTYCLIICTSPEINFDVKCLWAGGSGGGGRRWSAVSVAEVFTACSNIKEKKREEYCMAQPPPYSQWGVTHLLLICFVDIQLTWNCGLTEWALICLCSLCDRCGTCLN